MVGGEKPCTLLTGKPQEKRQRRWKGDPDRKNIQGGLNFSGPG